MQHVFTLTPAHRYSPSYVPNTPTSSRRRTATSPGGPRRVCGTLNISEPSNLLVPAGVLLLNTVLTVRAGAPASHAERGWEAFTETVLRVVDAYGGANLPAKDGDASKKGVGRGVVVLAWGAKAAKRVANLDRSKHLILTSAHPSPKSAANGFFGNGHFTAANKWLEERYGPGTGVEWGKL